MIRDEIYTHFLNCQSACIRRLRSHKGREQGWEVVGAFGVLDGGWTQMTLILSQSEIPGFQTLSDPREALCFGNRKIWVQILSICHWASLNLGCLMCVSGGNRWAIVNAALHTVGAQ